MSTPRGEDRHLHTGTNPAHQGRQHCRVGSASDPHQPGCPTSSIEEGKIAARCFLDAAPLSRPTTRGSRKQGALPTTYFSRRKRLARKRQPHVDGSRTRLASARCGFNPHLRRKLTKSCSTRRRLMRKDDEIASALSRKAMAAAGSTWPSNTGRTRSRIIRSGRKHICFSRELFRQGRQPTERTVKPLKAEKRSDLRQVAVPRRRRDLAAD